MQYEPLCRIDIYSHFFTITRIHPRVEGSVLRYAKPFIKYKFARSGGRVERQKDKSFWVETADRSEYRFHIGQLGGLIEQFRRDYIEPHLYEWFVHPLYEADRIDVEAKYSLRDQQPRARDFILAPDQEGDLRTRFISSPPGSGKSQPLDSMIKTPFGWKAMGKIKPWDAVSTPDGGVTLVTGVYPQGMLEVISFETEDGRLAESSLEHLWKVSINNGEWKVITTAEIMGHLDNGDNCYIPLKSYEKDAHLSPVPMDAEIYARILRDQSHLDMDNTVFRHLIETGVADEENLIPQVYLQASSRQRRVMVRELIGKTPFTNQDGVIVCRYKNESIRRGLMHLVWSLGGISWIKGELVFIKNLRNDTAEQKLNKKIKIVKATSVGEKECQCISVSSQDKLYITDNHLVTHNTVISLVTLADPECRTRTMITMLPKFMKKWPNDILTITTCAEDKICVVQGTPALKNLIQMAIDNDPLPNYIVFSLPTLLVFYNEYMRDPELTVESYGCHPQDLPKLLRAGQLLVDEAHEYFYGIYLLSVFNHIHKLIGLSGTLTSLDPFVTMIHKTIFPSEIRFEEIKVKKYIKTFAWGYSFNDMFKAKIRTSERGATTYSQSAFEESILRNREVLMNYLELIALIVEDGYLREYQEGDRFAVFAHRKDMCTVIAHFLTKRYPKLDVRRYIEKDPYKNLLESDIRVTTLQSGGTAHDIPKLRGVLMTNNLQAVTGILQCIGRLRELPDRDVKFYWMYSEQIPKHVEYHRSRIGLVADRAVFTKELRAPILL